MTFNEILSLAGKIVLQKIFIYCVVKQILLESAKPLCQCAVRIKLSFFVGGILAIVWKLNSQPLLWPF